MSTTKKMKSATASEPPRPYGDFREPDQERRPETFRLPIAISEALAAAAQAFECSKTFYVELALRNQFEKDRRYLKTGTGLSPSRNE
jgi:hypothetical protein